MRASAVLRKTACSRSSMTPIIEIAIMISISENPLVRERAILDCRRERINRGDHRYCENADHSPDKEHENGLDNRREILCLLGYIFLVELRNLLEHLGDLTGFLADRYHFAHQDRIQVDVFNKRYRKRLALFDAIFRFTHHPSENVGAHHLFSYGKSAQHGDAG